MRTTLDESTPRHVRLDDNNYQERVEEPMDINAYKHGRQHQANHATSGPGNARPDGSATTVHRPPATVPPTPVTKDQLQDITRRMDGMAAQFTKLMATMEKQAAAPAQTVYYQPAPPSYPPTNAPRQQPHRQRQYNTTKPAIQCRYCHHLGHKDTECRNKNWDRS